VLTADYLSSTRASSPTQRPAREYLQDVYSYLLNSYLFKCPLLVFQFLLSLSTGLNRYGQLLGRRRVLDFLLFQAFLRLIGNRSPHRPVWRAALHLGVLLLKLYKIL
jgi:hypothetical protein